MYIGPSEFSKLSNIQTNEPKICYRFIFWNFDMNFLGVLLILLISLTFHKISISEPGGQFKYSWSVYILFHMHFTQILHTISISLTVILALWRYIAIKYVYTKFKWYYFDVSVFCFVFSTQHVTIRRIEGLITHISLAYWNLTHGDCIAIVSPLSVDGI